MRKLICFLLLLAGFVSCKESTEINNHKFVFHNDCSYDFEIRGYKVMHQFDSLFVASLLQSTSDLDSACVYMKRDEETYQVTESQKSLNTKDGQVAIVNQWFFKFVFNDSIVNVLAGSLKLDGILSLAGIDGWQPYEYEEKSDTAIYTYMFNDKKMAAIIDFVQKNDYGNVVYRK
ncbi:MAG: hypothetical protein MJZ13_06740 [Bacteroidales bacterium]|nr:hypothetical protein [Bacteroidales bacterium]